MLCSVALLAGRRDREEGGSDDVPLLHSWHPSGLGRQLWNGLASKMAGLGKSSSADNVCSECTSLMCDMALLAETSLLSLTPAYCEALLSCASRITRWPWCECRGPSAVAAACPQQHGPAAGRQPRQRDSLGAAAPPEEQLSCAAVSALLHKCSEVLPAFWRAAQLSQMLESPGDVLGSLCDVPRFRAGSLEDAGISPRRSLHSLLGLARLLLEAGAQVNQRSGPLPPPLPADLPCEVQVVGAMQKAALVLTNVSEWKRKSEWGELSRAASAPCAAAIFSRLPKSYCSLHITRILDVGLVQQ